MSFLVLQNIRPVVAVSVALLGSVISLANPFEWPGDIKFEDVETALASSLSLESDSLGEDCFQKTKEYFIKIMAEATQLAQAKPAEGETQAQQEARAQLNEAVEGLLAQEKNEAKRLAALGAFKEELAVLTGQAQARAQRVVAVDNARKKYLLTEAPEKTSEPLRRKDSSTYYRGTVKDLQGNTKKCTLVIHEIAGKELVLKIISSLPFDRWSSFESLSHNAVKCYGYFIKEVDNDFFTVSMAFEETEFFDFDAYKKSVDGAQIIKDKKEVLKRLLLLGETLQEAHNKQLYHGDINESSFWLSKDAWKFMGFGLYETFRSVYYSASSISSMVKPKHFLAPESHRLDQTDSDPYKFDIFAFAILIQTLMLEEDDTRLKDWRSLVKDRNLAVYMTKGATPFTSYLFVKPPKSEPDSKLPKDFIAQMGKFTDPEPTKRGSLQGLVDLLRRTYDNWDTPVLF